MQRFVRRRKIEEAEELGHVARLGADGSRLVRIGRIKPQHVAIVLDRGTAAGRRDDDRLDLGFHPLVDRPPGAGQRVGLLAHVVGERSAAGFLARDDDLVAEPREQADGGRVDAGIEHALNAAHEQRHAALLRPLRGIGSGCAETLGCRHAFRHQPHERVDAAGAKRGGDGFQRHCHPCRNQGEAEQCRARHGEGQHIAQQALKDRAAVGFLDMGAGLVDQVHVVDARRACRHARQARQAAVDVLHRLCRRRLALFQHVLDEIDAAARAVEFIAQQHIGRAGGGAEAAMHALPQDGVGFRDAGLGQLRRREGGLHQTPRYMRPGLNRCCGSKEVLTRAESAASAASCGWNTSTAART